MSRPKDEETEFIPDDEAEQPNDTIKKLRERLRICQAERQEYLETSQRLRADYVNQKRQFEEERERASKFAKADVLSELIDLADTFELAFANREAWESAPENWRKGVEYIYAKLLAIFEQHGLREISPLGKIFDPREHHSLATIDTDKSEDDNKILAVVQKGYYLNGTLLRPAQVKVGHLINQ